jgi:tRNA pseudouridine38-40 synthase
MTARLTVEYDGSEFAGWARQPGKRSVQAELERALATILREPVRLTVAGRTDAGVHALAQVASYEGEPARVSGLNALLPPDVAVLSCERAPDGFNARFDATSRAYCYRLLARPDRAALSRERAWHFSYPIDPALLHACAAALVGKHDFTAFTPSDTYHRRFEREVLTAYWRADHAGLYEFLIEADTFMRNMNRVLVGTMVEVARGWRTAESFRELLEGAPRSAAGATAPARGLHLYGVGYGGERVIG